MTNRNSLNGNRPSRAAAKLPRNGSCPNPPEATNYSEDRDEENEQTTGAIPNVKKAKGFEKCER
jgi:hypothetical protein